MLPCASTTRTIHIAVQCLFTLLTGFYLPSAAAQQQLQPLPPLLRTLSDEVGVLSVKEGRELSRSIEEIETRTGVRMVMVIAETVEPEPIEDYAERLARRWERERSIDLARSIFVVIAVKDRAMQVSPGRALEAVDHALARRGLLSELGPLFGSGRYFDALMILTSRIREIVEQNTVRG